MARSFLVTVVLGAAPAKRWSYHLGFILNAGAVAEAGTGAEAGAEAVAEAGTEAGALAEAAAEAGAGAEAGAEAVAEAFATSGVLFSPVTSVTASQTDLFLSSARVRQRGPTWFC